MLVFCLSTEIVSFSIIRARSHCFVDSSLGSAFFLFVAAAARLKYCFQVQQIVYFTPTQLCKQIQRRAVNQ